MSDNLVSLDSAQNEHTVDPQHNLPHWQDRVDLAAALRWTARMNMHEGVANHFSLAVNNDGSQFLMNPVGTHFLNTRASDLMLLDANDDATMDRPYAPDPAAWGLHGALHRLCPHARCAMHAHPMHSTVLASLADSRLLPIDQNTAAFFNRYVIDEDFGGVVEGDEGARAAALMSDPDKKVMILGNHGILVVGDTPADTFNRLYHFERSAETYIRALQTGKKLRVLSDEIAEKTAQEMAGYPWLANQHLVELKRILDRESDDYAS